MWPSYKFIGLVERTLDRPGGRQLLEYLRLLNQRRQANAFWFYIYTPHPGDVILDIGAGNGTQTPYMAKRVSPGGTVVAVEAHPDTFTELKHRCERSGITNILCLNVAIGDQSGEFYIENSPHHEANAIRSVSDAGTHPIKLKAVTVDDLCAEQGIYRIDFLKMNIEGAERLALHGMKHTLTHTRHLCIACHDFLQDSTGFKNTKSYVVEFLKGEGFDVITRNDHPYAWVNDHVHAVNRNCTML